MAASHLLHMLLLFFSSFGVSGVTGGRYLIVFNGVMTEALSLSKALGDLLCVTIWVDTSIESQVPVYLREGLRTMHVCLPYRTTRLRTVTALMVDRSCRGQKTLKRHYPSPLSPALNMCQMSQLMEPEKYKDI